MKIHWMNLILMLSTGFLIMFVSCMYFSIRKYTAEYRALQCVEGETEDDTEDMQSDT